MDFLINDEDLLEQVDEYTLYAYYLNWEPKIGFSYPVPYRQDKHFSWALYPSRHPYKEYLWKDNAYGDVGDIFDLVQRLYSLPSRLDALLKVKDDFKLGESSGMENLPKIKLFDPPPAEPVEFRVKSRPLMRPQDLLFYQQFGISLPTLGRYFTTSLECWWASTNYNIPRWPRGLCFAYRVGSRYQIYQPDADKNWKFRTSLRHEEDVMGLQQLRGRFELLIITKSMKEVMMFDEFGIDAVACASENTPIPQWFFDKVASRYKRVIIWMDNDGKESSEKFYPNYTRVYVPIISKEKDPTDFHKHYGHEDTGRMIKQVLYEHGIEITLTA